MKRTDPAVDRAPSGYVPVMTSTWQPRGTALTAGFSAAAIVVAGVRLASLHGGSLVVTLAVLPFLAVLGAASARRPRAWLPHLLLALGGVVVFFEVPALLPVAPIDADPGLLLGSRLLIAVGWLLPTVVGAGQWLAQPHSLDVGAATLFGAAAALLAAALLPGDVVLGTAILFAAATALWRRVKPAAAPAPDVNVGVPGVIGLGVLAFFGVVVVHVADAAFGPSLWAATTVGCVLATAVAVPLVSSALSSASPSSPTSSARAWAVLGLALLWASFTLPHAPGIFLWRDAPTTVLAGESLRAWVVVVVLGPAGMACGLLWAALWNHQPRFGPLVAVALAALVVVAGLGAVVGLGPQSTLIGAALVASAVAVIIARRAREELLPLTAPLATVAVLALLSPPWASHHLASGTGMRFTAGRVTARSKIVRHEFDFGSDVVVASNRGKKKRGARRLPPRRLVVENGVVRAADGDGVADATVVAHALSAQAGRGSTLGSALVIGAGTGDVVGGLLAGGFAHVDVVDSAAVLRATAAAWPSSLQDGRVRWVADSGNNGVVRSGVVDLIAVAARPWNDAAAADLTSVEFYRASAARLPETGVLVQTLSLRAVGVVDVLAVVAAARAAFGHADVVVSGTQLLLVASETPANVAAGLAPDAPLRLDTSDVIVNSERNRLVARRATRRVVEARVVSETVAALAASARP